MQFEILFSSMLKNLFALHLAATFHPVEGLFKKAYAALLHSYCLGPDRSIQAFARPEIFYHSAITVASFSH